MEGWMRKQHGTNETDYTQLLNGARTRFKESGNFEKEDTEKTPYDTFFGFSVLFCTGARVCYFLLSPFWNFEEVRARSIQCVNM
jgi:hypothetical protein